jgi:TonB family protein
MFLFMRFYFFFVLFFLFSGFFAQNNDLLTVQEFPDVVPQNVGGVKELKRFFLHHVQYPEKLFNQHKEAKVKVNFVVMKDGSLQGMDVSVSGGEEFDEEALRLLKLLEWIPGQKNGEKVNSRASVTFEFSIDEYKKAIKERGFSKVKTDKKYPKDTTQRIISHPDSEPEYFRGENALLEFIRENLEYPELAKRQNLQGVVELSFVVENNGRLSNIRVVRGVGGGCSEEAVTLMGKTRWRPAVHQGKIVRARMNYAIQFSINNDYRSNELGEQK